MEAYELGVASAKIYDFIWDTYCDWYIELTKTRLYGEDEEAKLAASRTCCAMCCCGCWSCCIPSCPSSPRRSGRRCPTRASI